LKTRISLALLLLLAPLSLFAQTRSSSDVGVFLVGSALSDTKVLDVGDTIHFKFDEKTSYGVSFNHFWNEQFSTDFAMQKIKADLKLSEDGGVVTFNAGKLDATSLTALGEWHFMRAARFSPYVGAGVARLSGDFKFNNAFLDAGDPTKIDLESKTTWAAAAGANIRLTDNVYLGTELKYIPWSAKEKGGSIEDAIDVDPLTLAVGVRFRF